MRKTTIRLSPRALDYIARAAARQGVSFSQYVGEAALSRAVRDSTMDGDEGTASFAATIRELNRLMDELREERRRER